MRPAPTAFYERLSPDTFHPTNATAGPWDDKLQHGGPPSALMASMMLANHYRADMRLAKITVDFLGVIPRDDLMLTTNVVRGGKRIELLEASLSHGNQQVAYARAWCISVEQGRAPATTAAAPPPVPAEQKQEFFPGLEHVGYGKAIEWRFVEGAFDKLGPAAVWTRVRFPLIAGEAMTGLQRLLVVADAANGLSAELPIAEYLFIPPSLTVTIERFPEGEWIFVDAKTHICQDGMGMTHATVSDTKGFVGTVAQSLLVAPR